MTAMFKVQAGVPLPEINRSAKTPRRKYPFETMAVEDMFFIPGKSCKSVSAYVSRATKDVPGKWSARQCWMWQDQRTGDWRDCTPSAAGAVQGTGVWRVE